MADLTAMMQAAAGAGGAGVPTDPFFENTVLLLHGDGTSGAQNNTFLDSSTNNFTITRNGNTTQGTFTPFSKPEGKYGLLTNDRSFLTIPASSDFDLISTDFTVEFWLSVNAFNNMSGSGSNFFGNGLATAVNGWSMGFSGSGSTVTSIEFRRIASSVQSANNFTGLSIPFGVWHHVALVRSGSGSDNLKLYVNGIQQGAAQTAVTYSIAGSTFTFGSGSYTQNANFSGNANYNISNVRITKSALYTSNFTPSSSPLTQLSGTVLLLCQSNRLINNGTNAGAITSSGHTATRAQVTPFSPFPLTTAYDTAVNGGSGFFDNSGDFLQISSNAAFSFGTSDFTIEVWFNASTLNAVASATDGIITMIGSIGLYVASNAVRVTHAGIANLNDFSATLFTNTWHHLALTRSGTNMKAFINGVQTGSTYTNSTNFSSSGNVRIGTETTQDFHGYMSNLRVIKGTAVYTANFTPPTAPLTAITNTSLLCNFTNAGIFDNTAFNNLETVGNAQIDTSVKKYGTGSIEFDGTGDWLIAPNTPDLQLGTGNFTIEFWVYLATGDTGSNRGLVAKGGASTGFLVSLNTTQKVVFTFTTSTITSSGAITTNAWNHIAVVREGTGSNQTKIYIAGTNDGTGTVSTDFNQTEILYIGANRVGGDPMKGYIDDLRITKGIARYTTTFTPPTEAFSDIGA